MGPRMCAGGRDKLRTCKGETWNLADSNMLTRLQLVVLAV